MTEDLPLFQKIGDRWYPKPLASSFSSPILIKRNVPTKEANHRFLVRHRKNDVLTRHGRKHSWNPNIPYKYNEPESGEWVFYFAGTGKYNTKLWDVYFKETK